MVPIRLISKKENHIQPKLRIGQPNDRYEQEADQVADQVMRMPSSQIAPIQRKCKACEEEELQMKPLSQSISPIVQMQNEEEEEELLQPKNFSSKTSTPSNLSSDLQASKGSGRPLDSATHSFMSRSFGSDFSNVKVHTDSNAIQMNQQLNAKAFTNGSDVYFNQGQYNPNSTVGKHLLAHELTHTIQQGSISSAPQTIMKEADLTGNNIIQKSDAGYESGNGVGTGIAAGTMVADAIMGTTVTANNCRGLYGCNVGFKFSKAYKGVYHYTAAARDVKGVYVKIEGIYDHDICGTSDTIRFIQVVRNITEGTDGSMELANPGTNTRRERSGWGDASAPSRGWRIDRVSSAKRPFFGESDAGGTGNSTDLGSPGTNPILRDVPGFWDTDINCGREFHTFLVSENASGDRKIIAGVTWGHYTDGSGTISFRPATPIANCGSTQVLQDAATRWDGIALNQPTDIDFTTEAPVDHEGVRSVLWFETDSTTLRNDATIDSTVHYAIANRRIRQHILASLPESQIIIHGYASTVGDLTYNRTLSEQRANAIQTRLISEGIPANMITIISHGENNDFPTDDMNQRVEIETTRFLGPVLPPHLQPGGGSLGP